MRGKNKPNKSARDSRARMAEIRAQKPKSGPLERAPAAAAFRGRGRAPKPYLFVPRVPDPPPPSSSESVSEEQTPLPKAEKLFKNHLYNQSIISEW